ncbi:phage tail tape measure protein [Loigolactobacillus coryniformis]|uniref:phage tail tape measure protein n=1 Tax=Loigolactobacillus coryniformis TaxID=1610 RepID=UPI0009DA7225|nr:phage tail tape measure protein [Loigolactobacillus coryniformis]
MSNYQQAMGEIVSSTKSAMSNAANAAAAGGQSMVNRVSSILGNLPAAVGKVTAPVANAIGNAFNKASSLVQSVMANIANKIPDPLKNAMSQVGSTVSNGFRSAFNGAKSIVTSVASALPAPVQSAMTRIGSAVKSVGSQIPGVFRSAFSGLGGIASSAISGVSGAFSKITSAASAMASGVKNAFAKVNSALQATREKIKQTGEQMQQSGQKMTEAGDSLKSIFAPAAVAVGGAFAGAATKAASFEAKMSNVKALTGATGGTMTKLKDLAMDMGAKTAFSANEAADGIAELEKAGVSTSDIMHGGLKGALDLATAGELSLSDAAEIASTALNAFKSDNLSVTDAANQLAGAANASATDVHELQYGLSAVAPVAAGLGLSFNDTTDALAVFAQNGLKGSDAGTSLKTMLQNLQPSTKTAMAEMQKLGIVTKDGSNRFFDAKGNIKSMSEVSEILKTSMKGLTKAQQQAALKTMFGTDAVRAATIASKEGATGFDKMQKSISKVTAADVAKEN